MTIPTGSLQGQPPADGAPSYRRRVQTIYLTDKAKLAEPEWQLLLREPGLEFYCPCGLRVEPCLDPHHRGHNVRACRGEQALHERDCPVVHGEFALECVAAGNVIYTDSIFLPPTAPGAPRSTRLANGISSGFWNGDFGHLMLQEFTQAVLSALAAANRKNAGLMEPIRNPTAQEVSQCIAEFLRAPRMVDGASAIEAARRVGANIYWGVCSNLLVNRLHAMRYDPRDELLALDQAWTVDGEMGAVPTMRISHNVASRLRGKVWEYNRVIPPPYLVFASVEARGNVLQLLVIPICGMQDDRRWFSKESAAEGKFLNSIREIAPSVGIVKLGVQADLGLLGPLWPHRLKADGHLPCRPDVILIGRRGTAIYQLEGSVDPIYRAGVRRSLFELREFLRDPKILIRGVSLKELKMADPQYLDEIAALA